MSPRRVKLWIARLRSSITRRAIVDARVFSARKLVHYLQTGEGLAMP